MIGSFKKKMLKIIDRNHYLSDTRKTLVMPAKYKRTPTCEEILKGVPEWYICEETLDGITYIDPNGRRFLSLEDVREYRLNGPFEDVDWSVPSF